MGSSHGEPRLVVETPALSAAQARGRWPPSQASQPSEAAENGGRFWCPCWLVENRLGASWLTWRFNQLPWEIHPFSTKRDKSYRLHSLRLKPNQEKTQPVVFLFLIPTTFSGDRLVGFSGWVPQNKMARSSHGGLHWVGGVGGGGGLAQLTAQKASWTQVF